MNRWYKLGVSRIVVKFGGESVDCAKLNVSNATILSIVYRPVQSL